MATRKNGKVSVAAAARTARSEERRIRDAALKQAQDSIPKIKGIKGSRLTADSFVNFAQKMGVGADNPLSTAAYGFNPVTRLRTQLEWMYRSAWLAGAAVDLKADDMTRMAPTLEGDIKPDASAKILERCNTLGVHTQMNETIKWARLYGGAIGVMMIDGQEYKTPLRIETVGKDAFKGLLVLDRWMVDPSLNDLVTEAGPDIGMPKFYRTIGDSQALPNLNIHHSRVIRMEGIKMPYMQRIQENLWGISVIERLYDRMIAFDSATTGAAQLIYKAYIRTYKIKGLRELISAGAQAMTGLAAYVDLMRRFQGIEGMTVLDGDDEFEGNDSGGRGFAGISDALAQFGQQLAGALGIPLIRLFGQSPTGFNSGDTDMRLYYDSINQDQNKYLRNPYTKVYRVTGQSLGIALPDGFSVDFPSLWQMDDVQKAQTASSVADAVTKAVEGGLLSQKAGMQELKQSSRRTSIFSNITEDDIEAADDVVAPPAPEPVPGEGDDDGLPGMDGPSGDEGPSGGGVPEDDKEATPPSKAAKVKDAALQVKIGNFWYMYRDGEYFMRPVTAGAGLSKPWQPLPHPPKDVVAALNKEAGTRDSISAVANMKHHHDLDIVIENPRGTYRSGINEHDGLSWRAKAPADYGYVRRAPGNSGDGEPLDCHIGSQHDSPDVWVIHQHKLGKEGKSGVFDEYKAMLGFPSMNKAMGCFLAAYTDGRGWHRIGKIEHMSMDDFKKYDWMNRS